MVRKINFVTIGNSLTVGYIPSRIANQPYSQFLNKKTRNFLKQMEKNRTFEIRVINRGINGDLTTGMLFRFRHDVIDLNPNFVIILGGTNDIGWGIPVKEIFLNLKRMYVMAVENQIEPIGCTLPSILGWDEGILPRLKLNQLLKGFWHEKGILFADLFASTCESKTKRLIYDYSSDGIHLNTLGYRKIAETIFEESVRDLLIRELKKV